MSFSLVENCFWSNIEIITVTKKFADFF